MRGKAISPSALLRIDEPTAASLEEWDELASAVGVAPFLRPGWVMPWVQELGKRRLRIYAVRRSQRITALIPLVAARGALRSPTSWDTPLFGPVGESEEAIAELMRGVLQPTPLRLDLRFVDAQQPGQSEFVSDARTDGWRILLRTIMRTPYIEVAGGWSEYEQGRFGSERRRQLRRRLRKLQSAGEVSWEVSDGSRDLERLLGEGFRVEASGWKGERRTAILSRPSSDRFYRSVARWAAERGWLRLAFLRLDGRPLAFDLALEQDGTHYLLKTGFDAAYGRYSPGLLLRREMIKRSFDQGGKSYELGGHVMAWKLIWTDACRDRVALQAFAPGLLGSLEWAAFAWGRPAVKSGMQLVARATRRTGPSGAAN